MPFLRIGDIIDFDYSRGTRVTDPNPRVLVLHNNWLCASPGDMHSVRKLSREYDNSSRCIHGLNWNKLDLQDQKYLLGVMNPALELKLSKNDKRFAEKMAMVNATSDVDILSPEDFYHKIIRPMIKPNNWQPYRKYNLNKVKGVSIFKRREVLSGAEKDNIWARGLRRLQALRGR